MATTTFRDIVDSLRAAIEAIAPVSRSDVRFSRYPGDASALAPWAEQASEGAFRVFDVRHAFDTTFIPPHDLVAYLVQHNVLVEVAYPDVSLRYGTGVDVHGDTVIDDDLFDIDKAIGQPAARIDGHHDTMFIGQSISPYPGGRIVGLLFQLTYNRSIPS